MHSNTRIRVFSRKIVDMVGEKGGIFGAKRVAAAGG